MKFIREPLYGDIKLEYDDEIRLINTYEFQRLRRVRQLGLKHLVYPGATHTRFEHSLGTRRLVKEIITQSGIKLGVDKERLLFLASLVHDIGHLCFSHPIEEIDTFAKHDMVRNKILDGKIRDEVIEHDVMTKKEANNTNFIGDDSVLDPETREELKLVMSDDSPYPEIKGLLDNYIDADNLDYIQRDAFHLGLNSIKMDPRIFSSFRIGTNPDNGETMVVFANRRAVIETIENILYARWYLYKIAYLHPTVLVAESMLRQAIEKCRLGKNIDLFYILGDDELLYWMKDKENGTEETRAMVHRILMRDLNKRVYVLDNSCSLEAKHKVDALRRLTDKADFQAGFDNTVNRDEILITFPRKDSPYKEFGKIMVDDEEPVPLNSIILGEIRMIEEKYRNLWLFIVSVPTREKTVLETCNAICVKYFNDKGSLIYEPSGVSDEKVDRMSQLRKILRKISTEKDASLKVLRALCDGNEKTTDNLIKETGLRRSTISQYLNYLKAQFQEQNLDILKMRLQSKIKYWQISDEQCRQYILKGDFNG